ncbi:MAG: DNA-binding protein WhiA [Clostridiales bacterium]|nr:DNA-binding protein WhiA [Clostridiales bacterium]
MSFSMQVKNELVKTEYEKACCKKSLLYGMCIFGKTFSAKSVSLQTENENIALLYKDLLKELFNINSVVKTSPKGRNITVSVAEDNDAAKLFKAFGHEGASSLKINHSNFDCENCVHSFVAGAFLSCGTISTPEKDYHLEFTVPYLNLSKSLLTLIEEMDLSPKYTYRHGYNVVYFKESEAIEDCLYLMGASDAMFEMMNVKIVKDFRNMANRKANCETANINRMVNAASEQLKAIEKIWRVKGKEYLPENLEVLAEIRYENADLSLSELAEMCNPPLSRSGVNHRLKKIISIANEL